MKFCYKMFVSTLVLCLGIEFLAFNVTANSPTSTTLSQWPAWRGPLLNGVAPAAKPPVKWSEQENIKWKVKVPGFGTSTPVIWKDQVFILTAVKTGKVPENAAAPQAAAESRGGRNAPTGETYQFKVLSYDRKDGSLQWEKVAVEEAPHEGHHPDHGYASGSPVTDGEVLITFFGSRGLHCYDLKGNLKWTKDFGQMRTRNSFGEGASPALHGNTVVVVWDDETDSDFIAALDRATGKELWRTPRNEPTGWTTPLIVEHAGKWEVVVNAPGKVRSYDLSSGMELWQAGGQTANSIPTPVATQDTVYVTSGFRGAALFAIALGSKGDLTGGDAIRWSYQKNTPYVPSPLLVDGLLYTVTRNDALLTCFDAKTGKPHFEAEKLEGISGIYASPIAAGGRVYVLGRNGQCLVLKQGPTFEVLGSNKVEDRSDASLAAVDNELFLRGHEHLYCISTAQ